MNSVMAELPWKARWEAAAWLYMRLSGIVLLFLVLGHMLWIHVLIGVNSIDFGLVAARWNGAGWRLYDLAMLVLAMTHGALGIRGLAFEHVPGGIRKTALALSYAGCLFVTGGGTWVILTFPSPL
jgi:succinate dehydrogenase / fumarate reductase, membrane anchor subunit